MNSLLIFQYIQHLATSAIRQELRTLCKGLEEISQDLMDIDYGELIRQKEVLNIIFPSYNSYEPWTYIYDRENIIHKCSETCYKMNKHATDVKSNCRIAKELDLLKNNDLLRRRIEDRLISLLYMSQRRKVTHITDPHHFEWFWDGKNSQGIRAHATIIDFDATINVSTADYKLMEDCVNAIDFYYKNNVRFECILAEKYGTDIGPDPFVTYVCDKRISYLFTSTELLLKAMNYLMTHLLPKENVKGEIWSSFGISIQELLINFNQSDSIQPKIFFYLRNSLQIRSIYLIFTQLQKKIKVHDNELINSLSIVVNDIKINEENAQCHRLTIHKGVDKSKLIATKNEDEYYKLNFVKHKILLFLLLNSITVEDLNTNCIAFVEDLFQNINLIFTHRYFDVIIKEFEEDINSCLVSDKNSGLSL